MVLACFLRRSRLATRPGLPVLRRHQRVAALPFRRLSGDTLVEDQKIQHRPGRFHSPVVDQLWSLRQALLEDEKNLPPGKSDLSPDDLQAKTPDDSRTRVEYQFSENRRMAENYCNPWGQVRMGKILEDLDAMAGNIAMRHTRQADACRPLVIVTAGVDRIKLLGRAGINEDMVLEGAVTWTGRSSMEIGMQVHTAGRLWICANFTFVARDPETGRAAAVNKLIINTKEEQTLFDLADARQREKKGKRKKSKTQFDRQHTPEQARRMQDLLDKAAPLKRMPALAPKDAILMYKTQLSNALTCQPVHQNIHGRVFGGFLMRRAFELAFATAHLFSGGRPQFLEVDDVSFKLPVSIGDLLQLESVVLYTVQKDAKTEGGVNVKDHPEIHVEVVANVSDPGKVTSNMSNSFNFTFCVPDKDEVLNVYPGTVVEAERVVRMMTLDEDQERHDEEAAEADPSGNGPACR